MKRENDFVKFDAPFLPKPLFFRKAKSSTAASSPNPAVQVHALQPHLALASAARPHSGTARSPVKGTERDFPCWALGLALLSWPQLHSLQAAWPLLLSTVSRFLSRSPGLLFRLCWVPRAWSALGCGLSPVACACFWAVRDWLRDHHGQGANATRSVGGNLRCR